MEQVGLLLRDTGPLKPVISAVISFVRFVARVITWPLCWPVVGVLKLIHLMVESEIVEKCLVWMWWWMFLGPNNEPLESVNPSPDAVFQQIPHEDPQPSGPALAQRVQTIVARPRGVFLRSSMMSPFFWQGQRNNCFAIALLTCLRRTHPEIYLELLYQLYENGELHFRVDGAEVKMPANLTGDFDHVPADREPHELLAATLMQGTRSALASMLGDNLGEFAQKRGIGLPNDFREIFHPEFQWNQARGMYLIRKREFDQQLSKLPLDRRQIDDFYDFVEKKHIEIHGGCPTKTLQRVRKGRPLTEDRGAPTAGEDCIVFHGATVSRPYKILFGEQASRPVAVIDGEELCRHAQRGDYDYAPREILKALLKMKHDLNLPGGTVIPAESVQYHAFTAWIPEFDTLEEIEKHLSAGGHVVLGSTNWGPDMHIILTYDRAKKMVLYYGCPNGTPDERHGMGRCFPYSSHGRDIQFYDPMKTKFDVVDPSTGGS
jgi:hypothetical protein